MKVGWDGLKVEVQLHYPFLDHQHRQVRVHTRRFATWTFLSVFAMCSLCPAFHFVYVLFQTVSMLCTSFLLNVYMVITHDKVYFENKPPDKESGAQRGGRFILTIPEEVVISCHKCLPT